MINSGNGFNDDIRFVVASVYEAFSEIWGAPFPDKLEWVAAWSEGLHGFDNDSINAAKKFCISSLKRPPSLFSFRVYCTRAANNHPLDVPVISTQEMVADTIIRMCEATLPEHSYSNISDALLIAAIIFSAKANAAVGMPWDEPNVETCITFRAHLFGLQSIVWATEAKEGSGFWKSHLADISNG